MIIRIRCKAGNFRYELEPTADISELIGKVVETVKADAATVTLSQQPRGGEKPASELRGSLQSLGLKHGDLLFIGYQGETSTPQLPILATSHVEMQHPPDATHRPWELVKEAPVDEHWRAQEGKIPRQRDSQFCKHGAKAMCDYCMPLEPYDPQYQKQEGIKYLSYHAYLRKLAPPKSSGSASALLPPLEPLSYKVKVPCPQAKHADWPAGICSSCQPSAITLQRQSFRMVDHLEFASHTIVDRFLDAWRRTGTQRFGWLIGHYEPYDKVPMGIKAVVEAIHEPPQEGELDGLTLGLPWEDEKLVRELASQASTPLTFVGYIFTDLEPQEEDRTKNIYKRHPLSFYLSSLEVIFAARLQLENPTASRSSTTGKFASRLVTAVATATEDGGVDINAYQVSEQACAMVEADMVEASVDPGIVRVKEEDRSENAARYVPDVFFRYKNEYNIDVQKSAKPCFPVEYLLVTVTHGFPQNPSPMFLSQKFAIENRSGLEDQQIQPVLKKLAELKAPQISSEAGPGQSGSALPIGLHQLIQYVSDWHLLVFLKSTGLFSEDDWKLLLQAASSGESGDHHLFYEAFKTNSWETLMTFTRENARKDHSPEDLLYYESSDNRSSADQPRTVPVADSDMDELPQEIRDQIAQMEAETAARPPPTLKVCQYCTFENDSARSDCEICGLPLGG